MDCSNHVCTTTTGGGACVTCELCHAATYCSEECRTVDWVKHACHNVRRVAARGDTLFVRYNYEDRMSADELGAADPRSPLVSAHLAVHYGPDRVRTVVEVPALLGADSNTGWTANFVTPGRGIDPTLKANKLNGLSYGIHIEQLDEDDRVERALRIGGLFSRDTVYDANKNERVKRLLGKKGWEADKEEANENRESPSALRRGLRKFADTFKRGVRRTTSFVDKAQTNVVMWPDLQTEYSDVADGVLFDISGNLRIIVTIGTTVESASVTVGKLRGGYDLNTTATESGVKSSLKKAFEVRLQGKFKSTAGLHTYRAQANGMTAIVTFLVSKGDTKQATIRDIEFSMPKARLLKARATLGDVNSATHSLNQSKDVLSGSDDEDDTPPPPPPKDKDEQMQAAIPFRCDARVAAQLVGLTVALEHTLIKNKQAAADDALRSDAAIVRAYTRNIVDSLGGVAPKTVPMAVNTAVRCATEALYEYNVLCKKQ